MAHMLNSFPGDAKTVVSMLPDGSLELDVDALMDWYGKAQGEGHANHCSCPDHALQEFISVLENGDYGEEEQG